MSKKEQLPWENEPDELRFTDEATGLECYICRHSEIGHLNGYVIIPKDNVLYGANLFDNPDIKVHGGVTFSGIMPINDFILEWHANTITMQEVIYGPNINEYCIGFDCAHYNDLIPDDPYNKTFHPNIIDNINAHFPRTYKDIEYVKAECLKLAKQLHDLMKDKATCIKPARLETYTRAQKIKDIEFFKDHCLPKLDTQLNQAFKPFLDRLFSPHNKENK